MLLNRYRKLTWPVVKLDVTFSITRHISNWRVRRLVNALLVPLFILKRLPRALSGKLHFPQMGLTITRRCVLNCVDCVALYTHYRERKTGDTPTDELSLTMQRFLDAIDSVNSFGLGGGEPFLHKDFKALLNQALASSKVNLVRTYTTGMPIPPDDVLDAMATPRFAMGISDYGDLSKTMKKLLPKLDSRGITYRVEQNSWDDFGGFEKRHRSERELKRVFRDCWQRQCMIIIGGELHYCYRSAHAKDLGLIPDLPGDYVDLLSGDIPTVRERIDEFIDRDYIAACDHCNGAGKPVTVPRGTQEKPRPKEYKLDFVKKDASVA